MRIKDIPCENRPRERMKKLGFSSLSDAEVLALILQKGSKKDNVIDMSNKLIAKYGIEKLSSSSLTELSVIDGIGEVKAIQVLAAFELSKRLKPKEMIRITKPEDVFTLYVDKLRDIKTEQFYVLLLNTKNQIIKDDLVSIGTLDMALVHPREIFKIAIKESAASIILIHNHPSGDPAPSDEDVEISKIMTNVGDFVNIPVLDHIIIGSSSFSNFNKNNYLI